MAPGGQAGAAGDPAGAGGAAGIAGSGGTDAGSGGAAAAGGAGSGGTDADSGDAGAADGGRAGEPAAGSAAPPETIQVSDRSAMTNAWWAYERAETHTAITSKIQVPTRDGTSLGCTLSRPGTNGVLAEGKFPGLVVEFTPYALQHESYVTEAAFFTKRGYNTVVCNIRGTGDSGGTWQHAGAAQDRLDAYDLVEWLATQPFADGRMGQLGESYGGQTTYGSAVEQAPHLLAIAPMQPPADLYHDVNYPGGIETAAGGDTNNWPPVAELLSFGKISAQAEYDIWHAHPTYDDFWSSRSLRGRHDAITVPVLTIGGWDDGYFRSGTLTNIEGALERTWAIYGPFPHLPPVDLGTCDTACVEDPLPGGVMLAWFDHWVMQLPNVPIPERPTFVSFEGPKAGAGQGYRELSAWVPAGTEATTYELGADNTLSEKASATSPLMFHEPGEAADAGAALTFSTAPLDADRVLIGHPVLALRATLSAGDANFYVQLLDVDASDKETLVNDGFRRASYRDSYTMPTPAPVGEAIDYAIDIRAQHYRFAAGHRVRIRVWGGPKSNVVQPSAVDVTVETGPHSTLRMPHFAAMP
ncbi:MAG: CocE/NonD family hydrolase, partial [Polyangiales bacterium]